MVDISALAGAVSSLKTAASLAGGLVEIRDQALLQGKVIELQRVILEAQSGALAAQGALFELQNQVRSLNAELSEAAGWDAVALRYRLQKFRDDKFVYELRDDASNGEPIHLVCPNCFQKKERSILQRLDEYGGKIRYLCQNCKSDIWLGNKVLSDSN